MKLRAYALVNQYISGIHAGIQTAHALMEMSSKYDGWTGEEPEVFEEWRDHEKTIIVLNGGYQQKIYETMELWEKCNFPYAHFCEEQDALNGALTAAVIILPEYIYIHKPEDEGVVEVMQEGKLHMWVLDADELALANHMKTFRLKGE